MVQTKRADFNGLAKELSVSPVSVRIMRNRGMETKEAMERYLYGTLDGLYDGALMKNMGEAVAVLIKKLREEKRIRIIGDYDIDGVCASYLLLTGLRRAERELGKRTGPAGSTRIDYEIPDRVRDGYGINEAIIRQAAADGVDTLVTCDNGIAAAKEISLAKELGMTVVVTDHHEVPVEEERQVLPPADVVVDPKQEGETYPFREICGAVVAYKLVEKLYEASGVPREEWRELLEFAAIATVGDVMRLQDENRILVKYGLKQMARTRNLGLRKLVEKTGLDITDLSAYHIGFVIGPCLNAGGRLQTAKAALRLFLSEDEAEAEQLAEELKELNDVRKDMTKKGEDEAIAQVEERYMGDKVLVVFLPDCHESLAGIIAGRVREHFHKPSIVLTRSGDMVKGSGRSIEPYHMFRELTKVRDLLPKFGGHPMAAGLSIKEEDVPEFRKRLNENAELTEDDFIPRVWIDVPMPLEYVTEGLVEELKRLEPFGQGNEKPLFAQKGLMIRSLRVLGKNRNVVKLGLVTDTGLSMDGLLFGDGDALQRELAGRDRIDIVYYPDINEYNGNRTLQAVIRNYKAAG
ncbi:single-stranded-DNA-specific exonuclease RecJ [Lachnospiraceae bacterium BX10]|jgi:single-stranded-DNA-specific exonuclease|uniref:Single-stranded-DNA-specific exonuclease RecJ n=1 Tax=Enterocloster hominis (ex Liu et al. 2021) TaxID=2763663 RepID=A0ABR7NRA1_9FIRM|nr:single-stranded-DNA-specific exonuclease RecJ [Enterocloster hominis]MBC8597897.1 single-stranded-DNA-specific exonuclease RecJ [Enterocloster hominis]